MRDAARVADPVSNILRKTASIPAKRRHRSLWSDLEGNIREHLLTRVGIVAPVAYAWGAKRELRRQPSDIGRVFSAGNVRCSSQELVVEAPGAVVEEPVQRR